MATLEEVLAEMSDANYAHDDIQFMIDENLRTISIPSRGVVLGVVEDKDVNRVDFMMNRYYNGYDMSKFEIRVNYANANGDRNWYSVKDIFVNEETIIFSWLVAQDATAYMGTVRFLVRMLKLDGGKILQDFHTTLGQATVLEGLSVEIPIDPDDAYDMLANLKNELQETVKAEQESAAKSASDAAKSAEESAEMLQNVRDAVADLAITSTATGSQIVARDSAEWPMQALTVYGRTEQVQTSGAQLIDFSRAVYQQCTLVDADTGTIKSNISNHYFCTIYLDYLADYFMANLGKTISFRADNNPNYISIVIYGERTSGGTAQELSNQGSRVSIVIAEDFTSIRQVELRVNRKPTVAFTDTTSLISGLMLYEGSEEKAYEPYTGGKPSPSPDYPQPIVSAGQKLNVDGSVTSLGVEVAVTGKNLLDVSQIESTEKVIVNSDGSITVKGYGVGANKTLKQLSPVLEIGQKYTLSMESTALKSICLYNANATTAADMWQSGKSKVITQDMLDADVLLYCGRDSSGNNIDATISAIQIEPGTAATAYEPYRGRQTITLASNGLPGIPVTSGGNYTDADGQQWVCDTIEYRGGQAVYVQRVWSKTFTGSADERWYDYNSSGFEGFMCQSTLPEAYDRATGFCNSLKVSTLSDKGIEGLWFGVKSRDMYVHNSSFYDATLADKGLANWKAYLAAHPMTVMTYLTTATEMPLTDTETAQLAALHTYKPTTTVTNDAGVGMDMTYIADTKVYIDTNYLPKNFAVVNSWADVQKVVRMGSGHLIFPVGYEFTTLDSNTGNDIVWVVRGHNYHKAADESLKYTMTLETRHVYSQKSGTFLPLQFSAPQAAYYAADGLSAGTYHFTGSKLPWHSSAEGKKYQFTINNAIPAGGQIVINMTPPSSYTSCKIDTFSSAASSDPIESDITIAEGEEGTHIGIIYSGSGNMNIDGRVLYGSNNYAQSVVRQWLNSSSAAGSVWIPATNFDRPPKWNVSAPSGFAGGLPEDFLEVAQPAVVPCYTNAGFEVNGRDDTTFKLNTAYTLRDKFFLLSVPEIYPVSGLKQLEYYGGVTTNTDRIKYDIDGTKRYIWLRSNLSGTNSPSSVPVMTTNGNYSISSAADWVNEGVCPACIIA